MNDTTKKYIVDICKSNNPVILVDVFNHLFKYYFAHKGLSVDVNGTEYPTGHYYGFLKEILFLREKFPNSAIILVIDGNDKTRREINAEYKAGRVHEFEPMDIMCSVLDLCSLVEGVYTCYNPDYEADDGVCSICHHLKFLCDKHNIEKLIYILSTDKDMFQLISDGGSCKIRAIRKWGMGDSWLSDAEVVDEAKVRETFNGVEPKDLVKFRAMTGDSSDNLKGYYRFRKANASIIASNYDYDRENKKLVMKDGVEMHNSWQKFLPTVLENMDVFSKNYEVMLMKEFEYDLEKLCEKDRSEDEIFRIMDIANTFKLSQYMSYVPHYAKGGYVASILKYNEAKEAEIESMESVDIDDSDTISMNLEGLLDD